MTGTWEDNRPGRAPVEPTGPELQDAAAAGVDAHAYGWARRAGASHTELLEVHETGTDLNCYAALLALGAPQTALAELLARGGELCWTFQLSLLSATHAEVRSLVLAHRLPRPRFSYADNLATAELALAALRAACGTTPTRELGETIATLAQDWAGTADELASTAVALVPAPSNKRHG